MEIKRECAQYLEEYYKELFFGNVNKRYRAMTAVELRKRLKRLTEANIKPLEKANELSDVHAMLSKVCAYLMHKEGKLPPGPAVQEWEKNCASMKEFCGALARKDLEYLSGLSLEELEHVLRMQGIRRYLLTNSLDRAYQLFYIPKTIKKGIRESVNQKPEVHPSCRSHQQRQDT